MANLNRREKTEIIRLKDMLESLLIQLKSLTEQNELLRCENIDFRLREREVFDVLHKIIQKRQLQ